jgi:hypothetical protein
VPPEIQAAVDAGNVEETTKLLAKAPEDMSKSLKKKLLKNAEIAAKKLAKGGGAAAAPSKPAADAGKAAKQTPAAAAPTPPPAAPTGSSEGVVGDAERELVAELLACIEGLALPAEAMAKLRAHESDLGLAITPQLNAMRNLAYTAGFAARD